MYLAIVAGTEPNGSIDFRDVEGELAAEVHAQGGRLKETMKFPRYAKGLPNFTIPCRQAANAFKSFRGPLIALGLVNGQLILKEDRELFQFTYALRARGRRV